MKYLILIPVSFVLCGILFSSVARTRRREGRWAEALLEGALSPFAALVHRL